MSYCAEIQQLTGPLLKSVNWHGDGETLVTGADVKVWRRSSEKFVSHSTTTTAQGPFSSHLFSRSLLHLGSESLVAACSDGDTSMTGGQWRCDDCCFAGKVWHCHTLRSLFDILPRTTDSQGSRAFVQICSEALNIFLLLCDYSLRSMLLPSTILIPRNTLKYHETFVSPAID